jgi:predicted small metal-binding protein
MVAGSASVMVLIINCECGYLIRGETEDELVRRAREHIAANHPAIASSATEQDYLDMAVVEQPGPDPGASSA